jgi:hypothetical protein
MFRVVGVGVGIQDTPKKLSKVRKKNRLIVTLEQSWILLLC